MRPIDADELLEHVYRDRVDSRELIAEIVRRAPTLRELGELRLKNENLEVRFEHLCRQNERLKGEVKAFTFAVRCNSVSGSEVVYEDE